MLRGKNYDKKIIFLEKKLKRILFLFVPVRPLFSYWHFFKTGILILAKNLKTGTWPIPGPKQ